MHTGFGGCHGGAGSQSGYVEQAPATYPFNMAGAVGRRNLPHCSRSGLVKGDDRFYGSNHGFHASGFRGRIAGVHLIKIRVKKNLHGLPRAH